MDNDEKEIKHETSFAPSSMVRLETIPPDERNSTYISITHLRYEPEEKLPDKEESLSIIGELEG